MVPTNSRPETALGRGGRRPREESEIHPYYNRKSAPENGEHRNGWTCALQYRIFGHAINRKAGQEVTTVVGEVPLV